MGIYVSSWIWTWVQFISWEILHSSLDQFLSGWYYFEKKASNQLSRFMNLPEVFWIKYEKRIVCGTQWERVSKARPTSKHANTSKIIIKIRSFMCFKVRVGHYLDIFLQSNWKRETINWVLLSTLQNNSLQNLLISQTSVAYFDQQSGATHCLCKSDVCFCSFVIVCLILLEKDKNEETDVLVPSFIC